MAGFMVLVQDCNMSAKRCLVIVVKASLLAVLIMVGACSTTPLMPYTEDGPPLVLLPASQVGVLDKRGRFREIFCRVLEAGKAQLPDYRPCQDALTEVGAEAGKTGKSVNLGASECNRQSQHLVFLTFLPIVFSNHSMIRTRRCAGGPRWDWAVQREKAFEILMP